LLFFHFSFCLIISRAGWSSNLGLACNFLRNGFLFNLGFVFLGSSFGTLFFFLPRSNVLGGGLVELTQVDLYFFSSICLWFFFQFYHSALNYLSLSFVIFSLFFIFDYFESGLVKLAQGFFLCFFFIKLWFFLLGPSFEFFFLSRSHIVGCEFIKLPWVYLSFLLRCYIFYFVFVFIFDIKLLGFKLYNFILFFLC